MAGFPLPVKLYAFENSDKNAEVCVFLLFSFF